MIKKQGTLYRKCEANRLTVYAKGQGGARKPLEDRQCS